MDYQVNRTGDVMKVSLAGRLEFADHMKFREIVRAFESAFEDHSGGRVVLDLSRLEFLDSSGLGMFVIARNGAKRLGLSFVIQGAGHEVRRILDLSKFDQIAELAA